MFGFIKTTKNYVLIAVVVALAAAAGWQFYRANTFENQLVKSQSDLATANQNLDLSIAANTTNLAAISQLQAEKRSIEVSLKNLEAARQRDKVVINNLNARIRSQASNPENQVELSPVLKDTLQGIQEERARRGAAQ